MLIEVVALLNCISHSLLLMIQTFYEVCATYLPRLAAWSSQSIHHRSGSPTLGFLPAASDDNYAAMFCEAVQLDYSPKLSQVFHISNKVDRCIELFQKIIVKIFYMLQTYLI